MHPISGFVDSLSREVLSFKLLFDVARKTRYVELTYAPNGDLSQVDVWDVNPVPGPATKLFTRVLTYTGDDLTQVVTTNEQSGETLTATLVYASGDLFSVNEVIS